MELPENGVDIVRYSFPKRAYFTWIPILDFLFAIIVPVEKVPLKEVHKSIAPKKRGVYIRWHSFPGCQAAWISDINLAKLFIVAPIAVPSEEEGVAVQVSKEGEGMK